MNYSDTCIHVMGHYAGMSEFYLKRLFVCVCGGGGNCKGWKVHPRCVCRYLPSEEILWCASIKAHLFISVYCPNMS